MNTSLKIIYASKLSILMVGTMLLSACNTMPKNLREGPELSPLVSDVQRESEIYKNDLVRWGGSIVEINHINGETRVQVISRPLATNSRPSGKDNTDGRFLAVFDGFLEPEIYTEKRLLTVLGQLNGVDTQKIGDLNYVFPIVRVQQHHLWQKESSPPYPYNRGEPWGFWSLHYPYYFNDDFYSPLRHRPRRPVRH